MEDFIPPIRNTLPELRLPSRAVPALLANYALGTRGPADTTLRRLVVLFVFSADLAVKSYQRASASFEQGMTPEVCEQLEVCLIFSRRALAAMDRIAGLKDATAIDRATRKVVVATGKDAVAVRDAIIHMDERVAEGDSPDGTPVLAMPSADCSEVVAGMHRVKTVHLTQLLRRFNALALQLAALGP
jgi:hypothetical protein